MTQRTCVVIEREATCGKPAVGRGLCRKHYQRWWKCGDPLATKCIRGDDAARFQSKVDRSGGPEACWPWLDKPDPYVYGYGRIKWGGQVRLAHVVAWEIAHGCAVPDGYHIDHVCHNQAIADGSCVRGICPHRLCCNPTHLVAKSPQDHMADTIAVDHGEFWTAVLTEAIVADIKVMLAAGLTGQVIADLTGTSLSTVGRVRRGEDFISVRHAA
jgi:hypothetical protein